jgi:hypothetical protein
VDIWRERVLLKDEEGNRRTVALELLKTEVAAADDVSAEESTPDRSRPEDRPTGNYPYRPARRGRANGPQRGGNSGDV